MNTKFKADGFGGGMEGLLEAIEPVAISDYEDALQLEIKYALETDLSSIFWGEYAVDNALYYLFQDLDSLAAWAESARDVEEEAGEADNKESHREIRDNVARRNVKRALIRELICTLAKRGDL